jgi:heat shock protein HtpX
MSTVIGFGGSFISLAISKWMAKRSMGVKIIERPTQTQERWLVQTVERQAANAGIGMPEVGIFQSSTVNAFATGMNRNNALVAVSTGLIEAMDNDEIEAVLAHEVSHVANGDMITMGLIQGVVNTFVVFLSRIIGFFVDRVILKNQRGLGIGYFISSIFAQIILSFFASMIVMWFSRHREFRADEGGAALAGKHKMISALKKLRGDQSEDLPGEFAAFGINGGRPTGLRALLMSHPPLDDRIAALERYV